MILFIKCAHKEVAMRHVLIYPLNASTFSCYHLRHCACKVANATLIEASCSISHSCAHADAEQHALTKEHEKKGSIRSGRPMVSSNNQRFGY